MKGWGWTLPFSQQGNPDHIQRLADYWAEAFGGPAHYSESHGGQSGMLGIHAGHGTGEDYGPTPYATEEEKQDAVKKYQAWRASK